MNNPLSRILIQPEAISRVTAQAMLDYLKQQPEQDLSVFDPDESNRTKTTKFSVDKKVRDTQMVDFGDLFDPVVELYHDLVQNIINPFYNFKIRDSEVPQLLKYQAGGHYMPHVDGESLWQAPDGDVFWRKSTDRDLSTVIFLNDEFEGGEFVFPDYRIRIKPEPGLLICFPSTHEYLHAVEPVIKGTRYSIVNWMTVVGYPTMAQQTQDIDAKYNISTTRKKQWQNT
jgi:predicted 2-oxoglutarate/Fe(II)-dependent dioxygenase YbiX